MGAVVLDADVVIAFLDASDAQHDAAVRLASDRIVPDDRILIPASVFSEILVGPERAGTVDVIERFIQGSGAEIVALDQRVARRAARLRARHQGLPSSWQPPRSTAQRS
jgi:predicted nucleic acid-binding protein